MSALKIAFWLPAGLLCYSHLGYPAILALLAKSRDSSRSAWPPRRYDWRATQAESSAGHRRELPTVSVIVPAYAEEAVISGRVSNLRSLSYPRHLLEIVVACD